MPHFTIDAQGETNPLTVRTLYQTLLQASGGEQQSVRVATEQLSNWEKQPGFYSALQDVYLSFNLPQSVRFQAVIQLKNGIDKHWRKTSTNAIGKDEKVKIRSTVLSQAAIQEPALPLALQNALMIAKIVRYDFPQDWPDAISQIITLLRSARPPQKTNILTIALQVTKELASGKLQRTRKSLQQVASELLAVLVSTYGTDVSRWMEDGAANDSYLTLKIIRRLLLAGYEHPHRDEAARECWQALVQQQSSLWSAWGGHYDVGVKHLLQISKLHLEMADIHPASFGLLPGTVDILGRAWSTINMQADSFGGTALLEESKDLLEKLALRSLLLLRAAIKMVYHPAQTFKYQQPQDKQDRKNAVELIKVQVLREDAMLSLLDILVSKYFPLQTVDLEQWRDDPDEVIRKDEADAWEHDLHRCSEKLFLDLVVNYKSLVVPELIRVFQEYALRPITDENMLQKESIYAAIGIAAPCLAEAFNFNSFLSSTLVKEMATANLIPRRIAILLGQWTPVQPQTIDRKAVFKIFTQLLSSSDKVVRVTAGRHLRSVLDAFDDLTEFQPFAGSILQNLMAIASEGEETDTQIHLLETLQVSVSGLGIDVEPYANLIIEGLSQLWAGGEDLLKQEILTIITALVSSSKSTAYTSFIVPLIKDATQPKSDLGLLLEEVLDLWIALIQITPQSKTSQLLSLWPDLIHLFEELGSASYPQMFDLARSYILLSPALADSSALFAVLKLFLDLLGRDREAGQAPELVETMIAVGNLREAVGSMGSSGFVQKLAECLEIAYNYHQKPQGRTPDLLGPGEIKLFNILARIAIADAGLLFEMSSDWLLLEWIEIFDSIGDVSHKKLHTLALSSMVTSPFSHQMLQPRIFENLLSIWTDVLTELSMEAEAFRGDYLWQGIVEETVTGDTEEQRQQRFREQDPIYCINARDHVASVLRIVASHTEFTHLISQVDPTVLKAFEELQLN